MAAAAGQTLAAAAAPRQAATLAAAVTAPGTSARKRSLTWSSKRCSRQEGLAQRTTIWATTGRRGRRQPRRQLLGPGHAGTRRARRAPGGQDCGPAGFGSGQPLDVARPGPVLAGAADRVHAGALRRVSDDELTGMIRAWRRLSSWATARELGAIAEFARRRPDEDPGPGTDSDVARRARARRAASGPPEAATQAGSLRLGTALSPAGRTRRLRPARPANPAAQAAPLPAADPAAQGAPADGTAGANPAAQAPRLLRLPRLAGRTRRLRRALPPVGGPPPNRAFPR